MKRWPGFAAAVCLIATLGGCGIWGPEGGPGGTGLVAPTSSSSTAPVDATAGPDGVQRVDVHMGDNLRFTPSWVRAKPGVIEFVFHNDGTTPHAVQIETDPATPNAPADDGTGNLNGGQSATVRVTVTKPGQYPFPCAYHISSGMTGTLEILP